MCAAVGRRVHFVKSKTTQSPHSPHSDSGHDSGGEGSSRGRTRGTALKPTWRDSSQERDGNTEFDRIDQNGDGVITRGEFRQSYSDRKEAEQAFDQMDKNGNGVISKVIDMPVPISLAQLLIFVCSAGRIQCCCAQTGGC